MPVRNYLRHKLGDEFENHIKKSPDLSVLNSLLESQFKKKLHNDDCQFIENYGEEKKPEEITEFFNKVKDTKHYTSVDKILVLLDDCLSSNEMRAGASGKLALFSTFSRHANIVCIWVSQCYARMPKTVREMCDLTFYFYNPIIHDLLLSEWFNKEDRENYKHFLKTNFGKGKQYSFLCLDFNASNDGKNKMYQNGQTGERFFNE